MEGHLHALPHQQVSGGPNGVFNAVEGEPQFSVRVCWHFFLAHPTYDHQVVKDPPCWQVQELLGTSCCPQVPHGACLTVSGAPHPGRGQMEVFDMPRECITALTGRISWAIIHAKSRCWFWRAWWATLRQTFGASPMVNPHTEHTCSCFCTQERIER